MPRDVNGTYSLPTNDSSPAAPRNVIRSSDFNELTGDYATALTDSFSRSGKGAALADLDMDGFDLLNPGNLPTNARAVNTGTGLTGGGNLSADRTIALNASSIASLALADSALQPNTDISVTGIDIGDISVTYNNNNELIIAEGDFFTFGDVGGTKFGPNGIILGRDGTDSAVAFVSSIANAKTEVVINPSGTPVTDEWTVFSLNRVAGANEERLNYAARGGTFNDYVLGQVIVGAGAYRPLRWNIAGHPTLTVNTDDDVLFHQRVGVGVPEGVRPGQLLEVRGNGVFGTTGVTDYGIELKSGSADWKNQVNASNGALYWFDQVNSKFPFSIALNAPSSALTISTDTSNPVNILVNGVSKAVVTGAADSGGAGFRLLRVSN